MPQQMHGKFFGATEKVVAQALFEAGQTDTEIALSLGTSVNNIVWWRKEEGLTRQGESHPIPVARPAVAPAAAPTFATPVSDARFVSPAEAQATFTAPVQPDSANALEIGRYMDRSVSVDLEELLMTRLLIQGNSGSGKSHLLRKLLEESAGRVQQIIIDPEGDFPGFGENYGHMVANAVDYSPTRLAALAGRVRETRVSIVLNLDGLEIEQQMRRTAAFLGGLFDAPREHWHPALVAIDEAHLFAPVQDNGEDKDIRKESQLAMANLMCRGRKRGLAGIVATQRLAKLHKNVAGEASNFLMGRTMLDIDIGRAADLLGLPRKDTEQIRDLSRGEFLGLGPAISKRPMKVRIGAVQTEGRTGPVATLAPPPPMSAADLAALMDVPDEEDAPRLRVVK